MMDRLLTAISTRESLRRRITPMVRAYLRYGPSSAGKWEFWNRVASPYFAWHPYEFEASTLFGSRIGGNTTDLIQNFIYYFGLWEPQLTYWIWNRLAKGGVFVDVGANIGYFTLLASRRLGTRGSVVAVEASPRTFEFLQANVNRNQASNVRAVNVAAADRPGVLTLYRAPDSNIGMTGLVKQAEFEVEAEVPAASLSALLRPEEIERARIIKIDVEGAEGSVLAGAASLLEHGRPDLEWIVEVHPKLLEQQGGCAEDVIRTFAAAGYHAYRLNDDFILPNEYPRQAAVAPVRLAEPVREETTLIFSRTDAECLPAGPESE